MTAKTDFTPEAWDALLKGPLAVNIYIVAADPSVFGSIKEVMALSKDIVETLAKPDTGELLRYMLADLQDKDTVKRLMPNVKGSPDEVKAALRAEIEAALQVLEEKATPEESQEIRQWMYDLAVRTAEASKEGGFLGIGAVRVSPQEKQALEELAELLGVEAVETEVVETAQASEEESSE